MTKRIQRGAAAVLPSRRWDLAARRSRRRRPRRTWSVARITTRSSPARATRTPTKPFELEELTAPLLRIVRRTSGSVVTACAVRAVSAQGMSPSRISEV